MTSHTKALVIGFGSIGARHARILKELTCDVAVVTRRECPYRQYASVEAAITEGKPDYVVIANRTNEHFATMESLHACGFRGKVLVEKPLFDKTIEPPPFAFSAVAVAYNFRFHPLLVELKSLLGPRTKIQNASIYYGSYLPSWRPGTDYRACYSAKRVEGGGVLRDLSHELDYATWLFGDWVHLAAAGGHLSDLEIDSDDVYSLVLKTDRCAHVGIHLNYLDRVPRRQILVNVGGHSIAVDLIENTITIDGVVKKVDVARDDTYRSEHRAFLSGAGDALCTMEEGLEIVRMIEAAERASAMQAWVTR